MSILKVNPGKRALREAVSASITPMALVGGFLFLSLTVIHPFVLPGNGGTLMAFFAAMSAVLCFIIALVWKKTHQRNHAHLVMAFLTSIPLANTVLHFALFQQATNTINFVVLMFGAGLVLLSRESFYSIAALAMIAWLTVVNVYNVQDLSEWGWFLFFAIFIAAILEEQRIHATRASGTREQLLLDRSQTLQDLLKTPALSGANLTHALNLIVEAARVNLVATSVTIWLPEDGEDELKLVASSDKASSDKGASKQQTLPLSGGFKRRLFESRTIISSGHMDMAVNDSGADKTDRDGSSLYTAIISAGSLAGIILADREVTGLQWTLDDQMFAASIADLANLALQTRQRIELEGQARKAEHLESLGVLAGGVAHDFNNLLMVILGNIDLMQESQTTSSESKTRLQSMMDAGIRARDLAQQMLAYAGKAHRQLRTIDLASFGSEIDRDWARDLLDGINVTFDIEQGKTFAVDVDPTQIRQVVMNLLTNARDAGASQITISVGSESGLNLTGRSQELGYSGCHWLEVKDNGCGMPESEIERIFEPFYTTRATGSGLGLAASLGIMRAHLGTLTAQSQVGQGSQLRMRLPCSSKQPAAIAAGGTQPNPGLLAGVQKKTKILLIEDETLLAELASTMLTLSGRDVQWLDSFATFERELPLIDLNELEFALIDVTLNDGSGLDAAGLMRQRRPDLPVILMSGYDARNVLSDQRLTDSVEFLSKPFSRGALQNSIEQAVARVGLLDGPAHQNITSTTI